MPDEIPVFDEAYYRGLWGTVHRHDYAEEWVRILIQKYGKVRILDIGCGCGYLVKRLRECGCDAWGLDASEFAVKNACDPHVVLGDVRAIPFSLGHFDVVFSTGLWCHIREEDVDAAWAECQRAGTYQEHNIDYDDAPDDTPYFFTQKSEQWWKDKFYPPVLVACPTHEVKEYAIEEWIACVKSLDYPNYDVLVVDNSPTDAFFNRWKDKIPMIRADIAPHYLEMSNFCPRLNQSMDVIRNKFLSGKYCAWFNLEADNIVPPHSLSFLMKYHKQADWVSHYYPNRGAQGLACGIGISLLSRRMIEAISFSVAPEQSGPDAWLWEQSMHRFSSLTISGKLEVKHLGTGVGNQ